MTLRRWDTALLLGTVAYAACAPYFAQAQSAPSDSGFTIPRQELSRALLQLAHDAGRNILFAPDLVRGKISAGVKSAPTFEEALREMLAESGLSYRLESDGSITLLPAQRHEPSVSAHPAHTGKAAGPSPDSGSEIVVTARHRPEPAQTVPISIAVVAGDTLARRNLHDLEAVTAEIPGLTLRTGGDRNLFIRGVGTVTTSQGIEPSVATVVDGVTLARSGQTTDDLVDIERIEVLRGPQGTLFGKNASAGVVNIITKDPTDEFHASVEGGYYQGDEYRFKGNVSGPLIEGTLAGRLSLYTAHYRGNVRNLFDGSELNGYRENGGRMKLGYSAWEGGTIRIAADLSESISSTPLGVFVSTNQIAYPTNAATRNPLLAANLAITGVTPGLDNRRVSFDGRNEIPNRNGGASAQVDWKMSGDFYLTSISAYRIWTDTQSIDFDQTSLLTPAIPEGEDHGHLTLHQESQEVRLASPKGSRLDYIVGLYYQGVTNTERYERDLRQLFAREILAADAVASYSSTNHNYAVFGEENIELTHSLQVIAGYRAIWDDVSYDQQRVSTSLAPLPGLSPSYAAGPGSTSAFGHSARLGLKYDITPTTNTYFTFSQGYKGPGFNVFFSMQPFDRMALRPETSNNYEAGLKTRLDEGRLQIDVAAFDMRLDNYMAGVTDVVAGAFVNRLITAGRASTRGVEGDISFRPTGRLRIGLEFADDNARVDHFNCPPGSAASCNIDGKPLPFAPRLKINGDVQYTIDATDQFNVQLDSIYRWQSEVQYSLAQTPDTIQRSYGIWNASVALIGIRNRWQVRALCNNILDRSYSEALAPGNLGGIVRFVPRDDLRYFGVNVVKTFGTGPE